MPHSRSSATQLALIFPTMTRLDLTDTERDELVRALRRIIDNDQFPLSPRIRRLRQILDRIDPPAPRSEPLTPPKPWTNSSIGQRKGRGRR